MELEETVGTAFRNWFSDAAARHVRGSTLRAYRHLERRLAPIAEKRICDLTRLELQALVDAQGSRSWADRLRCFLRWLYRDALADGLIEHAPTDRLRVRQRRQRRDRVPMPDEMATLLQDCEARSPDLGVLCALLAFGGLRLGEACALRVGDIQGRELVVQATVARALHGAPVLNPPKNGAPRRVQLGDELARRLARHIEHIRATSPGAGPWAFVCQPDRPQRDQPWSPAVARLALMKAADWVGLAGVRPHALRHFHGSRLIAVGASVEFVRRQLGHASLRTTEIYIRGLRIDGSQWLRDAEQPHPSPSSAAVLHWGRRVPNPGRRRQPSRPKRAARPRSGEGILHLLKLTRAS